MTDWQYALIPFLALAVAIPLAAAYNYRAECRWRRAQLRAAIDRLQASAARLEAVMRDFGRQLEVVIDRIRVDVAPTYERDRRFMLAAFRLSYGIRRVDPFHHIGHTS